MFPIPKGVRIIGVPLQCIIVYCLQLNYLVPLPKCALHLYTYIGNTLFCTQLLSPTSAIRACDVYMQLSTSLPPLPLNTLHSKALVHTFFEAVKCLCQTHWQCHQSVVLCSREDTQTYAPLIQYNTNSVCVCMLANRTCTSCVSVNHTWTGNTHTMSKLKF